MLQTIAVISLAVFFVLMLGVGIYSSKQAATIKGFLLGGRKIGPWMSAFAYGTTYFSAVVFVGYAGRTGWNIGIGGIWIGIFNALIGSLLSWFIFAKRTRRMTHVLRSGTMPEFFEGRYRCVSMKIFAAVIIFIFLVPYAASVYMGLGYLFAAVFFPNAGTGVANAANIAMIIIAVCTVVYLVLGGYVATVITDFIQGIIMLVGVVIMVLFVINHEAVGGLTEGIRRLSEIPEVGANLASATGGSGWFGLLSLICLTSFAVWSLPQVVHKFYAIKDDKNSIKIAAIVSTVFAFFIGGGAYLVGSFGRLILNNQMPGGGTDNIIPSMLSVIFTEGLPQNIIFSVILLMVLSASMSTLASVVLTSSSAIAVDLIKGYFKPDIDSKVSMVLLRVLCVVFVCLSLYVALNNVAFIVALMAFAWGVLAGSFLGPFFWGLYSRKTTKAGAWAGMLSGFLTVMGLVCWYTFVAGDFDAAKGLAPAFGMYAMIVSFVVTPVVSAFTKKMDEEYVHNLFTATPED